MRRLLASLSLAFALLCPIALPVRSEPAPAANEDPQTQTVYITKSSKKYHRDGCRYLAMSKTKVRGCTARKGAPAAGVG